MSSVRSDRVNGYAWHPSGTHNGFEAFTLLELLLVIAVIGVVAGLILPALGRVRAAGNSAQCVSNLRQLGLAGQLYWNDHDGTSFAYRQGATNGGDLFWFGWLDRGAEGQRRFDPRAGVLYPHLSTRGVETCPELSRGLRPFKPKGTSLTYSYGYNLHLAGGGTRPPANIGAIPRPGDVVFLADSAQINTFQPPASPDNPMLEEFYYVNDTESTAHFRHARHAQAVFCDGHVGRERMHAGTEDKRMPGEQVGRLPDQVIRIAQ